MTPGNEIMTIRADRQFTVTEIGGTLNSGHDAAQRMLEDLGYKKKCVPYHFKRQKGGNVF